MAAVGSFCWYSNTIYDCCRVYCMVLFTLGCSGLTKQRDRFNYSRKSVLFSIVIACGYVGSLVGCVYANFQYPVVQNLDSLIKSIVYLEIGMSIFLYLSTVCSMLSNTEAQLKLYARIHHLDKKLLQEFSCKLNYEKLRRKYILIFSLVVLCYTTILIVVASKATHSQEFLLHLFTGLAYMAVVGGPNFNCLAQTTMTELLRNRFRRLQKLLTKQVVCSSKQSTTEQVKCLRSLISLVQEYHNCIRQINHVYSACLASKVLHDFTLATSLLYFIFGSRETPLENPWLWCIFLFAMLQLYNMTIAPVSCDKAMREGEKCFQIIMDTESWFPGNRDVHQTILSSVLWDTDNKTKFLCGTMIFNKKIIVVVFSKIFDYLLILIQFRMTQDMSNEIVKQKNMIQGWIGEDYV